MGYFKTRGLRGNSLEDLINRTNIEYLIDGLAVIQKIPTPIKPIEIDSERHVITLAYFDEQSTVDYIGNVQGVPTCFDAKETKGSSLALHNLHKHQVEFMKNFSMQDGVSFILVDFVDLNKYFAMEISDVIFYYEKAQSGGRKSIPLSAFEEKAFEIGRERRYLVHYLPAIQCIIDIKKTS